MRRLIVCIQLKKVKHLKHTRTKVTEERGCAELVFESQLNAKNRRECSPSPLCSLKSCVRALLATRPHLYRKSI